MASAENRSLPRLFARLNGKGVPWVALITTYVVGLIFFLPFPSWQKMVGYISSITVLSYGIGPILLVCLRRALPNHPRPFRLWAANFLAPAAFICANWVVLWAGAQTLNFMLGIIVVIFLIHVGVQSLHGQWHHVKTNLVPASWLLPYFGGLWALAWVSPSELGGHGHLDFLWLMGVSGLFSLATFYIALKSAQPIATMKQSFSIKTSTEHPLI